MVRAKFAVQEKTEAAAGNHTIKLIPVVGGSPENDAFYKYTPAGNITLTTINADAAKQFAVGQSFYVDFTPVE